MAPENFRCHALCAVFLLLAEMHMFFQFFLVSVVVADQGLQLVGLVRQTGREAAAVMWYYWPFLFFLGIRRLITKATAPPAIRISPTHQPLAAGFSRRERVKRTPPPANKMI